MNSTDKKPGVGVGIMILKDNKVLLGKRNSDPEKADSKLHGENTWTMPGGKLDFQEELEEAVLRETLEETGIKISKEKLKIISVTNDRVEDAHFVTIGFLCQDVEGEAKVMEPDEIIEWKWFDLNSLPSSIFPPSGKILKKFLAGKDILS
jgi:8-oxo-dGTP diphosphatase